jgi:poly(3-hydroxyalkanoate) synthetase
MWRVGLDGVTGYWAGAVGRGATPWGVATDVARYWSAATRRELPEWHTPHEIVLEAPYARLRDFSAGTRSKAVPTLVLPPQAGHDSCIVDFSPTQSQMKVIRAAGLKRAFSLDWIGATEETSGTTVDDYLAFIRRSVEHIGGPVNLVGDCQGGWLATIYAALHPEDVHTLTIAGAPIDFHAGDAVIHDWVQSLSGTEADLAFYRWVVEQGGGVLRGSHMLNGFILIKPENEVAKHAQLLAHLHDATHMERHRAFETWFKHTQDIPGAFYLWIVEHLFTNNSLVNGELEIGGERVDLGRIRCPLYLLAGEKDHITPPAQVFALADHASTAEAKVTRRTTAGGHLGLFMGGEALREHWPPLLADVYRRSRAGARPIAAERRARRQTVAPPPPIPAP